MNKKVSYTLMLITTCFHAYGFQPLQSKQLKQNGKYEVHFDFNLIMHGHIVTPSSKVFFEARYFLPIFCAPIHDPYNTPDLSRCERVSNEKRSECHRQLIKDLLFEMGQRTMYITITKEEKTNLE